MAFRELFHVHLALFQHVDVLVNLLQLAVVRGTIEVALGRGGDVRQRFRVNFHGDVHVLHTARHRHRIGRGLVRAHADGIDADAEAFRDLRTRHRREVAHIVRAVGQQNDHFRLRFRVFQTRNGVGQTHSHGCSIAHQSAGGDVGANALQQVQQRGVVGRHWALREGFAGENRQSDVVVRTVGNEFRGDALRCLHSVRFEVFGEHRGRNVHRQHNVDAFGCALFPRISRLRTSQSEDNQREGGESQQHRQVEQSHPPTFRRIAIGVGVAHSQRRLAFLPVFEIPK